MIRSDVLRAPTDPFGFVYQLGEYLIFLKMWRYPSKTLNRYRVCIEHFIRWCEEQGIERPSMVTRPMLKRYMRLLRDHVASEEPLDHCAAYMPVADFMGWLVSQDVKAFNMVFESGSLDEVASVEHRGR